MIFRLTRYLFLLALFVLGAFALHRFPGNVQIQWFGYDIHMTIDLFLAVLLAGIALFLSCFAILWFFFKLPERFYARHQKKQAKKIDEYIQEAALAFSGQEWEDAEFLCERVLKKSNNHVLGLWILSQTLLQKIRDENRMDEKTSQSFLDRFEIFFSTLIRDQRLEFVGLQGLIIIGQKNKEDIGILLEQAYRIRPNSPWIMHQLLDYDLKNNRLEKAIAMIDQMQIMRAMEPGKARELKAKITWEKAQAFLAEQNFDEFCTHIYHVLDICPTMTEATLTLANYYGESNRTAKALKILKQGYAANPSWDYGKTLEEILLKDSPQRTPLDIFKAIIKMTDVHAHHPETSLLRAAFALKADLWGEAATYLEGLESVPCEIPEVYEKLRLELDKQRSGSAASFL